jgi:hypothetical protein
MPRRVTDQAILTGVIVASEYGLVLASQSVAAGVARALTGGRDAERCGPGARALSTVALIATGAAVGRFLAPRSGESLRRAAIRTAAHRTVRVGAARLLVDAFDTAAGVARSRGHAPRTVQAMTAGGARLVGVGIATWLITNSYRSEDPGSLPPARDPFEDASANRSPTGFVGREPRPPVATSLALGAAVALCLEALAVADTELARGVTEAAHRVAPASGPAARVVGRIASLVA